MQIDFTLDNLIHPVQYVNMHSLYMAMLHSLFFFYYPSGRRNVSREEEITLLDEQIAITRTALRDVNPSSRSERMLIKSLHTLGDKYRGITIDQKVEARDMAARLAHTMRLSPWYEEKKSYWENEKLKV